MRAVATGGGPRMSGQQLVDQFKDLYISQPLGGGGGPEDYSRPVGPTELTGVTGGSPLRPEDFCELGNAAVEASKAAAAGDPDSRFGGGGGLLPGEGGLSEEVVVLGSGRGPEARRAGLTEGAYEGCEGLWVEWG